MKWSKNTYRLGHEKWGLTTNTKDELMIGGCNTVGLAERFGTPLHIVDENHLKLTAQSFRYAVKLGYPGYSSVHFAFKCNPVPGIIRILKAEGLKAEVMTEFELRLAILLGFTGDEIIVNGPYKPEGFLSLCLKSKVKYIVIDSIPEIKNLIQLCDSMHTNCDVLLRINPDVIPKGMNKGSATGSRRGCAFGLDLKGGEPAHALKLLAETDRVRFRGYHFHIGTGIHNSEDYHKALVKLRDLVVETVGLGFIIKVLDIGGGLASSTSREMTTKEMILYQGWDKLPDGLIPGNSISLNKFIDDVTDGIRSLFGNNEWPELIVEPGRSISSSSQILLLGVHQVKERAGVKKWIITDGGIGTVSMPTYYEYHEVFLCNDIRRAPLQKVTITGPGCFASDIVYRNKYMPDVKPGEVLAVMDSGAYFTSWESNFSHPRPPIVAVRNGKPKLIRKRESFEDMIRRDLSEAEHTKNHDLHETIPLLSD